MHYYPLKPLIDFKPFLWDEDEWPEVKMTSGLNVYEEGDQVIVEAAVPGIPSDKIKVTYEDGVLRISAKSEDKDVEKKGKKIIHQWNKVASFEYTTYLPRPIDSKSLEAKVKDGVITVSAAVAETAKSKEIEVKVA
ncbi:Hsp20/alpha crystallin family protein [Candidatus Shapirobacteria bacterium]|nr:Hsp20/alpha crystallin family protein [Candidatus Shapirobacteria bacterium]